jgi:hypothetical protein
MERLLNAPIPHSEPASSFGERGEANAEIFLGERLSLANEWLMAARNVAERANSEVALETLRFLEERAALGIPMPKEEGAVLRRLSSMQEENQDYIYLTPILKSDYYRLPEGDDRRDAAIGNTKWVGMFNHIWRAVYFSEALDLSETGKGVVLLHEAVHARNEIEKRIDRRQPGSHWLDEADANAVEFDILKALGGDEYHKLAERIEASADARNRYKWTDTDSAVLDNMFGADISMRERRRWGVIIGRAILYDWYRLHEPDPRQALALLLEQKAKEAKAKAPATA